MVVALATRDPLQGINRYPVGKREDNGKIVARRCSAPERFAESVVRIGMQFSELLARRIVMEVVRSTVDGGGLNPVILHEVARHLQIDEVLATAGLNRGIEEGWLIVEGYRIRLTEAGRALLPPR